MIDSLNSDREENLVNFFKETFKIDIEKYNEAELKIVISELNKEIQKMYNNELQRNIELSSKLDDLKKQFNEIIKEVLEN